MSLLSEPNELHADIFTWCKEAQIAAGGGLTIVGAFSHWVAPSLPAPFQAVAVFRLRGRVLPSHATLRWQLRTMSGEPVGPSVAVEALVPEAVGGWQVVTGTFELSAALPSVDQQLFVEISDLEVEFQLPLPVVLAA